MATHCLRCFCGLRRTTGARSRCPACGHLNISRDLAVYWNQVPAIRRIEALLKLLIVLATTAAVVVIADAVFRGVYAGRSGGYLLSLPFIPAVFLWRTASALTRRMPMFHAGAIWTGVAAASGLFAAVLALYTGDGRFLVVGAVAFLAAVGIRLWTRLFRWWKARLVRGAR